MELTREHFRAMIYYDFKDGLSQQNCFERLKKCFDDHAPSRTTVYEWYASFKRGRASLEDDARSGRPLTATLPKKVDKVLLMVEENRRITIEDIEGYIGIGSAAVQSIIHEHLGLRKLITRWVPHFLTVIQKKSSSGFVQLHAQEIQRRWFKASLGYNNW